ncbi:MAG: hypothetical protein NVS3B17_15400 [Vulcanimicrobiaceae bacterium]
MWLRTSLSVAAFALTLAPLGASAAADVRSINGIEIITFGRDATPSRARPRRTVRKRDVQAVPRRALVAVNPELRGATSLVQNALRFVGTPYVWGGSQPGGFDCSGFIYYLYAQLGIRIPRTADYQFAAGRPVVGDPMPGDLVFFQTYDYGASHVGLYLGQGRFVNSIGSNVHVATFASSYFRTRYLGARRFLST